MDKSLVVSVFVPTLGEQDTDQGGAHGRIGTGYPVGRDLILTSRHVVRQERRDRRYPIKIRWWGLPQENAASHVELPNGDGDDDSVVWESDGDLDALLLRCPRPPGLSRGYGIVSEERPASNMTWESQGFPEAGAYDDVRRSVGFSGKVYPDPDPGKPFELSVEANPLESKWGGASGMPVFANKRILGVVRKRPPNFDGTRLLAVPSWRLLEDPDFSKAIGHDCQKKRRKDFQERLTVIFEASSYAAVSLAKILALDGVVDVNNPVETASTLTEKLLELELDQVIKGLRAAHRQVGEEKLRKSSEELNKADEVLVEAALLVVPVLYDHGVVEWARNRETSAETDFLELPVGASTVAEIVMAAFDGREASFRQRQNAKHFPEGQLSLAHAPEGGMDKTIEDRVQDIQGHLAKKFEEVDHEVFRRDIDGYLSARFFMPELGQQTGLDERKAFVAAQIDGDTEDTRRHFYMVFRVPDDGAVRQEMEAFIRLLKTDYPSVIFLMLPNDNALALRDRKRFDPFVRMLPTQGA